MRPVLEIPILPPDPAAGERDHPLRHAAPRPVVPDAPGAARDRPHPWRTLPTAPPTATRTPAAVQRASAARTCSGVGAVPPRWAGIHQVSSGPLGRTG